LAIPNPRDIIEEIPLRIFHQYEPIPPLEENYVQINEERRPLL